MTSHQPLAGAPVPASWDPRLSETMRRVGRRIEEELVLEELLADLAALMSRRSGATRSQVRPPDDCLYGDREVANRNRIAPPL